MAMPPVIAKILAMSAKLEFVPTVDKITGQFSSEVLSNHASESADRYGAASATQYGHTALSSSVTSTLGVDSAVAATPSAVKTAYDTANQLDTALTTQLDNEGLPVVPETLRNGGLLIYKDPE